MTRNRLLAWTLFVALLLVLPSSSTPINAGQKTKPTLHPTMATFAAIMEDGSPCGICEDGRGAYHDGIDGVSSYRVAGTGTTNGWAWDLNARRTTEPRTLTYDVTKPVGAEQPQGTFTVNDTHGQVYDLSDIPPGTSKDVRAAFHLFINRVEYVVRFAQKVNDGTDHLEATRSADGNTFRVRTRPGGDRARYLRGNGPSAIPLGLYHVPIDVVLTNQ